ncbi:MAG: DNA replication and repair protein RecF [Rikenellaceae bacterium]
MLLKRLSIINFKNIEHAQLDFEVGINAFVGDNGAGKSNILDAIYYLSMCKSMLSLTDAQNVRHGADFFVADGAYSTQDGRGESIVCSFNKQKYHTKTLKRNTKEYEKLSDHIGLIPVVVVTPQDSVLITQAADERRRFLNSFISQLDSQYLNSLIKYNTLIVQRNKVLKSGGEESMLSIYDEQMRPYAEYIFECRRDLIAQITPLVERFYRALSGDKEQVTLEYISILHHVDYIEAMQEARRKDLANEFTTVGVHRDDMQLSICGYPLRKYGSQGQQKSFLIALKLAQYMLLSEIRQEKPILLLDDLFDKLDAGRVEQLIRIVSGDDFGQIFITDCNRTRLERILSNLESPYRLFDVSDGGIEEKTHI